MNVGWIGITKKLVLRYAWGLYLGKVQKRSGFATTPRSGGRMRRCVTGIPARNGPDLLALRS